MGSTEKLDQIPLKKLALKIHLRNYKKKVSTLLYIWGCFNFAWKKALRTYRTELKTHFYSNTIFFSSHRAFQEDINIIWVHRINNIDMNIDIVISLT